METALKEQHVDETLRYQRIVEIYTTYMESAKIPIEKFKVKIRSTRAVIPTRNIFYNILI